MEGITLFAIILLAGIVVYSILSQWLEGKMVTPRWCSCCWASW